MISVSAISKSFGKIQAVNDVSFTIGTGEIVGFIGPNGAGKSTTMRCITGFFPPDSGQIKIGDYDITKQRAKAQALIGYLPESSALYTQMRTIDFLEFMGKMHGLRGEDLNSRLRVVMGRCRLGQVLTQRLDTLSKGFRQRVGLAQALLHDPAVLILDEPTVGLDPVQVREVREVIREYANTKTILISTHILSEVETLCSRVIMINKGRIILDKPVAEIMGQGLENKFVELVEGKSS